MDPESWNARLASVSKRYQSLILTQTRSGFADGFMGLEDIDGDDDIREDFACPFCAEYFDIVELCCHIDDEHPVEPKTGECPVCAARVGIGMVAHITLQHGNIFKIQRKSKLHISEAQSTLSFLKKEWQEGNLQSLIAGSTDLVSSPNTMPDPLSSFILPMTYDIESSQSPSLLDTSSAEKGKEEIVLDRNVQSSPLSVKEQEERARRSDFVSGLLLSTFLDDTS